jgi:hypothetical protein
MRNMFGVISSSFVCAVLAAGCLGTPATTDEPVADTDQVGQSEQELGLGGTTQAQERFVTYYSDATLTIEVGWCSGPFRCVGPKGLVCSGTKTRFAVVEWTDCGLEPLPGEP